MISLCAAARSNVFWHPLCPDLHPSHRREWFSHQNLAAGKERTPCSKSQEEAGSLLVSFPAEFPHPAPYLGPRDQRLVF